MPCLGFLPGSNCPHYDSEPMRRPSYRQMVARGSIVSGLAADDGVALHFEGTGFKRAVSSLPRARAWRVRRRGRSATETRVATRYLGKRR
jgi:peptidase E